MNISFLAVKRAAFVTAIAAVAFTAAFTSVILFNPGSNEPSAAPVPSPTPTGPAETPSPAPSEPPATPTPTSTPSPTPEPTQPPTPAPAGWDDFGQSLQHAVDNYWAEGRYAASIVDLQTGAVIAVNGDQHQLTGCVANLFVLISAMQDVESGLYDASVVDELIASTIWSSNATAAFELYKITGGGSDAAGVAKVQAMWDALGMTESRIDHAPAYSGDGELALIYQPGEARGAAVPDETNNWTTANDMAKALKALYASELLSPEGTADLLDRLTHVKAGLNYLVAYVPGEAEVSHKNGFFPDTNGTWVDNDIGIVRVERDGVSYAYGVTFFSDSVTGKYNDIALGQEISRLAWEYFDSVYGTAN